jgi:hypothetical protein
MGEGPWNRQVKVCIVNFQCFNIDRGGSGEGQEGRNDALLTCPPLGNDAKVPNGRSWVESGLATFGFAIWKVAAYIFIDIRPRHFTGKALQRVRWVIAQYSLRS